MKEYNSIANKNIETAQELKGNSANAVTLYRKPLIVLLKKIMSFICYGPGVLGFLWLIGRILKR